MPSDKQLETIGATLEQAAESLANPPSNVESKYLSADGIKELADAVHKLLENKNFSNDIDARKKYANRIFWLVASWLAIVLGMLLLQGFFGEENVNLYRMIHEWKASGSIHFALKEDVLLALIGGTTTGVIGLFLVVAKYLFAERKLPSES